MADRRMFAKSIVMSDAFLDMPTSARCLYFTLGMLADDDGFVNSPRSIMRQTGASDDDMKLLIAKKFILIFESGVIVIKHWRINNYLRADRHTSTTYIEEKNSLAIESNGAYTQKLFGIPDDNHIGIPSVNQQGIPSIVKNSIEKDSIEKDSIGKGNNTEPTEIVNEAIDDFQLLWATYPKKLKQKEAMEEFAKVKSKGVAITTLLKAIDLMKTSNDWKKENGKYIPMLSNWLKDERWTDVPIDLMFKKDLKPLPKAEDIVKEKK